MMDWALFWTTFLAIFLAELGDKTQIGVLSLTATKQQPVTIFVAASAALLCATLIGVLAGSLFAKFIEPRVLSVIGGILFITIGCWIIFHPE